MIHRLTQVQGQIRSSKVKLLLKNYLNSIKILEMVKHEMICHKQNQGSNAQDHEGHSEGSEVRLCLQIDWKLQ